MADQAPDPFDDEPFDLINCTPAELLVWLSGYRTGIWQGTAEQIRRREAEDAAVYAMAVDTVHKMATIPPHSELEDARQRRTFEAARRWATGDGEALSG